MSGHTPGRCEAVDPNGLRCICPAGHDGNHTALIPECGLRLLDGPVDTGLHYMTITANDKRSPQ